MKYLLVGDDYQILYIEEGTMSFRYNQKDKTWVYGGSDLFEARTGFDPYEPEGSPYRYGSSSSLKDIVEISKEEAEKFISSPINEEELKALFLK